MLYKYNGAFLIFLQFHVIHDIWNLYAIFIDFSQIFLKSLRPIYGL